MSAIARFLVEFEPSPLPSPAPSLPAPFASPDDGIAIEELDDDAFGLGSEPNTGDLDQDVGFGGAASDVAVPEPALADTSVAEAVEAALAIAEAGFSARIATLEEEHARMRAEDRTLWVETEAAALAEGFRKATAEIEEHICDAVAEVLEPLMAGVCKSAALHELRQAIATLTASGSTAKIEVAGPEDLVQAIRTSLDATEGELPGMAFTPSQDAEVTVTADNSTIRTRLAAWALCFKGSLGEDA